MRSTPSARTCGRSVDLQPAFMLLTAGHRDGVVEEDLVGDVGLGIDGQTQRQDARMVVGAVAEILEDVVAARERRLADPIRTLAAHLGRAFRAAVHPHGHVMAADAGIGARALRQLGRGVMRTARAEIGGAHGDILRLREHRLRLLQARHRPRPLRCGDSARAVRRWRLRCRSGRARPSPGKAICRARPSCRRRRLICRAVELFANLHLDERAFFLDHDDHVEPGARIRTNSALPSGQGQPTLNSRMPRSLARTSSMPRSSKACRTSR